MHPDFYYIAAEFFPRRLNLISLTGDDDHNMKLAHQVTVSKRKYSVLTSFPGLSQ